jgi:endonuclease YncB( thermonuclease family)
MATTPPECLFVAGNLRSRALGFLFILPAMGWRVGQAYEVATHERWRALPWRERYNWPGLAFLALSVAIVGALFWTNVSYGASIQSGDVSVIDGDTIRLHQKRPDVRLVGFNTPETRRAVCDAERQLGARATGRLREIVRAGNLDFEYVRCSCPPGTEGTKTCNFGRRCGTLKAGGRDVGAILIAEKLAVPFVCGSTSCPPTPKPWCE